MIYSYREQGRDTGRELEIDTKVEKEKPKYNRGVDVFFSVAHCYFL